MALSTPPNRTQFRLLAALAAAITLSGCTVPPTTSVVPPTSGTATNWQIQQGTAITNPPADLYFTGALQTQGSTATGVFTSAGQTGTTTQVLDFTGSFSSTTQIVALFSNTWDINFSEPSTPNTITPVNVIGGCVGDGMSGPVCTAIFAVPSVGVEIAPLSGTYTGTLTHSASSSMSGTGSLMLTQSATPNASGQFPLTGSLTFPSASDLGTVALTGTISGEGITLNNASMAVSGPTITLTGYTNPTAAQITITSLSWTQAGTTNTFTGTLTH